MFSFEEAIPTEGLNKCEYYPQWGVISIVHSCNFIQITVTGGSSRQLIIGIDVIIKDKVTLHHNIMILGAETFDKRFHSSLCFTLTESK